MKKLRNRGIFYVPLALFPFLFPLIYFPLFFSLLFVRNFSPCSGTIHLLRKKFDQNNKKISLPERFSSGMKNINPQNKIFSGSFESSHRQKTREILDITGNPGFSFTNICFYYCFYYLFLNIYIHSFIKKRKTFVV